MKIAVSGPAVEIRLHRGLEAIISVLTCGECKSNHAKILGCSVRTGKKPDRTRWKYAATGVDNDWSRAWVKEHRRFGITRQLPRPLRDPAADCLLDDRNV